MTFAELQELERDCRALSCFVMGWKRFLG